MHNTGEGGGEGKGGGGGGVHVCAGGVMSKTRPLAIWGRKQAQQKRVVWDGKREKKGKEGPRVLSLNIFWARGCMKNKSKRSGEKKDSKQKNKNASVKKKDHR